MKLAAKNRLLAAILCATFAGALAGYSATTLAADGIRAAYVEVVIPSRSYSGVLTLNGDNGFSISTGPSSSGVLGITNVTISNSSGFTQSVEIGLATFPFGAGSCGSNAIGINSPSLTVYVQPQSTLVIPFPTPFVINPSGGQTCIAAHSGNTNAGDTVSVYVNGLLN